MTAGPPAWIRLDGDLDAGMRYSIGYPDSCYLLAGGPRSAPSTRPTGSSGGPRRYNDENHGGRAASTDRPPSPNPE